MKRTHTLIAASVIAVGLLALPNAAHSETKQESQSQKLDKLLQQRRDTLRQLVKVLTVEFQEGQTGFESVFHASAQLIDAELELAKNTEARIVILQRRVELLKKLFSLTEAKSQVGEVSTAQVLAAKAALLEAQIRLLREQADGVQQGS